LPTILPFSFVNLRRGGDRRLIFIDYDIAVSFDKQGQYDEASVQKLHGLCRVQEATEKSQALESNAGHFSL